MVMQYQYRKALLSRPSMLPHALVAEHVSQPVKMHQQVYFVSAKISQLSLLPQGQPEKNERVKKMVSKMDEEGFGHCTNTGACQAECPKEISVDYIRKMNLDYNLSNIKG